MNDKWRERKALADRAWKRLRGGELTPRRAALSVGLGLLIGITPAFGLHWLLVVAVCVPLRLDTGVAYLAANISMPLIAPFITFAEVEMGAVLLHGRWLSLAPKDMKTLALGTVAAELALGTLVVAPAGGLLGGAIHVRARRLALAKALGPSVGGATPPRFASLPAPPSAAAMA